MKKIALILAISASLNLSALEPIGIKPVGIQFNNSADMNYRGDSGVNYKYDLNRPVDKIRYDIDVNAKFRDDYASPYTKMKVESDRDRGQFGGGFGY